MKTYIIMLRGCDDCNYIKIQLNYEQADLIKTLAKLINEKSESDCMPTMHIKQL